MTHGYEFFEYDFVDMDFDWEDFIEGMGFQSEKEISDIEDRDSHGKFQKGHIPWNKGMKMKIYDDLS